MSQPRGNGPNVRVRVEDRSDTPRTNQTESWKVDGGRGDGDHEHVNFVASGKRNDIPRRRTGRRVSSHGTSPA